MANYQNLKAAISAAIRTNGNQEITGQVLQNVLNSIVSVIGANYTFAGVATPAINPGTPDQNVMYLAMEGGTYTNFNGTVLPAGISLLMWNGSWTSETVMYGDGGVFDISVYKSSGGTLATYADLSAALDGGNNIPASARKGGMSVKFVQSSDNKYVQYRLMANSWSIDTNNWSFCGNDVYVENPEHVWAIIDNDDKILCGIKTDGKFVADIDGIDEKLQEAINQIQTIIDEAQASIDEKIAAIDEKFNFISWIEDPEGRSEITTDSDGKIVSYRDEEGVVHENIGIETKRFNSSDVYYRNQHKEVSLLNAGRVGIAGNGSSQNLQLTVVNDSHTDDAAMKRAVEITNRFHTIEGLLHCGDITQETYTPDYVKHFFDDIMSKCEKPWFITVGNHDAGNTMYVSYGGTHEDMYNSFIKPMIDAGNLAVGEYEVGKSYYFHDFPERKVRMIVTYDYDTPITSTDDLYESNYWEPIAYNASYPQLQEGHDYVYDANNPICVNCGSYKYFSFRLKQSVHTTTGQYVQRFDLENGWSRPAFKIARGVRVIRKDQADWFINTLSNTPAEYGVLVVSHIPISANFQVQKDKKFTSSTYKDGYIYGIDSEYPFIDMETDIFCDIVQAFIDKGTLVEHVVMKKETAAGWEISDARYMNVNTDPQSGEDYAYNISADFSNVPSSCHFISFVGGHHHAEIVYRHLTYRKLWAYHGVTLNQQYGAGDLARAGFTNTASSDNVNAISFTKNRMALVRIGNDETIYGKKRDFEVINTNND